MAKQNKKSDEQERAGFNCTKCGKFHIFGVYVHAHWDMELTHTCDCGQKHTVLRGNVEAVDE